MNKPLMGRVVAIWLVHNTSLTFKQISDFCAVHELEVQALADEDKSFNHGLNPILTEELTKEEISRCEKDPSLSLVYNTELFIRQSKTVKTSESKFKKQNKPEAILWLIQKYSKLSNYQIAKLLRASPSVVKSIREKQHWNYSNIKPKNPIALGFCEEEDLNKAVKKLDQA